MLGLETGTIGGFTVGTGGTIGGFTVGTGGTIRGPLISAESANEADSALHRLHSSILSDGDLRSDRVHGEDARHNRGRYRRHATFFTPSSEGASRSEGVGLHQPPPGSTRFLNAPAKLMETCGQVACTGRTRGTIRGQKRHNPGTIDFGGVRK